MFLDRQCKEWLFSLKNFKNCFKQAKQNKQPRNIKNEEIDSPTTFEENMLKEEFVLIKNSIDSLNKEEMKKKMKKEQEILNLKQKRKKIAKQKKFLLETIMKKQELEKEANEILIHEVLRLSLIYSYFY